MCNKLQLRKNIIISLFITILPNLLFYISSEIAGLERVFFNIDYFLPILFLSFGRKYLYYISFVFVRLIDFLLIFGQIFPIIRISDLFYLLKFSLISSDAYKLYGFLFLVLLLLKIFTVKNIYRKEYNIVLLIIFNIVIVVHLLILSISHSDTNLGKLRKPKSGFASSLASDYFIYYNSRFIDMHNIEGNALNSNKVMGATSLIWRNKDKTDYNKILLIINESWGVPTDIDIQNDVLFSVSQSNFIENFEQNTIDFDGFTIAGELRELCQKAPVHFNLKNQEVGFEDCLPHYYKSLGYKTVAVHGALSFMYDRRYWYPRVGFEEILFRDTGLSLNDSFCYSFPGNCDKDIANVISNKFKENESLFLYWLTLNTHSNYDMRDLDTDMFDCDKYNIKSNSASCRNLKLQKQFFFNLSKVLDGNEFKGSKVIIVGDHEPPIISTEASVFMKGKVPVISFNIKE